MNMATVFGGIKNKITFEEDLTGSA